MLRNLGLQAVPLHGQMSQVRMYQVLLKFLKPQLWFCLQVVGYVKE